MKVIKSIDEMLQNFIQTFFVKYKYENRGLMKKFRIDSRLNLELDEEKWCECFLFKACLNRCAQIIIMRILEDRGLIYSKMNRSGIEKWKQLVQNLGSSYHLLFDIGQQDLVADENKKINSIFRKSDYDIFVVDGELANIVIHYSADLNLSDISQEELIGILRKIYSLEQREEWKLEEFYKEAPALTYLLSIEKEDFTFWNRIKG
ncbi:hypothetical protein SAMN02745975_03203 [Geosporobacter subterraneus DSM 17957]|uniref:Uncharacterized protein n=1 Tax=Geosporobacter subterraneus DSM 17957 TaxID=1121919 RepID=A0A1M6N5G5_9FIRM|nr:hypothetical protein [Geosporobacter subterraneus]SHJ90924.1 hypothetical protein SAMN02745975_03203 [Geosporobacter subterraneus DSM 17957]